MIAQKRQSARPTRDSAINRPPCSALCPSGPWVVRVRWYHQTVPKTVQTTVRAPHPSARMALARNPPMPRSPNHLKTARKNRPPRPRSVESSGAPQTVPPRLRAAYNA